MLKCLKYVVLVSLFASSVISAAEKSDPGFQYQAKLILQDQGIEDARVIKADFLYFTYCRKGSQNLWRYEVISDRQLAALQAKQHAATESAGKKTFLVQRNSVSCKAARYI